MESIARGRESQYQALHTRKAQIDYTHSTLCKSRKTYHHLTQRLNDFASAYKTTFARLDKDLSHLENSTTPVEPQLITQAEERLEEAALYLASIKSFRKKLRKGYKEAKDRNLAAIEIWERELGMLLVFLSGPGSKTLGWVWAGEEPAEYEDGDGAYVPPVGVVETCWDEFHVREEEMFI